MTIEYFHTATHRPPDSYESSLNISCHVDSYEPPSFLYCLPYKHPGLIHRDAYFHTQFGLDTSYLDCPWFYGSDADEYVDWISEVETHFKVRDYDDPTKCTIAAANLLRHAAEWWDTMEWQRIREGKPRIQSWRTMKTMLIKKFHPEGYLKWKAKRSKMISLRIARAQAASTIQAYARGMIVRRNLMKHKLSAAIIQRNWRATLLARFQDRSVVLIQTHARGLLQRCLFLRMQRSAILIQTHVRQWFTYLRAFKVTVDASLSDFPRRVVSSFDLLQRFGQPLLPTLDRDPSLPEVAEADDRVQLDLLDWDPGDMKEMIDHPCLHEHIDFVLHCFDLESAALSLVDILMGRALYRPPPEPPDDDISWSCSKRPVSETGTYYCGVSDSAPQSRPLPKPPWRCVDLRTNLLSTAGD